MERERARQKKIIRKIIDSLWTCVFILRRIDPRISADPRHTHAHTYAQWATFFKKSVTCLYYSACVYALFFTLAKKTVGCLKLILFFFAPFLQFKWKIKSIESKIYCRLAVIILYIVVHTLFVCTPVRSFTQAVCLSVCVFKSQNPNEIRKHRRNFLDNDAHIKDSVDIIHHNILCVLFFVVVVWGKCVWLFLALFMPHEIILCVLWLKDHFEF